MVYQRQPRSPQHEQLRHGWLDYSGEQPFSPQLRTANTSGDSNTASGFTASGALALFTNTTGSRNTADGDTAVGSNTTGNQNTASGYRALIYSAWVSPKCMAADRRGETGR